MKQTGTHIKNLAFSQLEGMTEANRRKGVMKLETDQKLTLQVAEIANDKAKHEQSLKNHMAMLKKFLLWGPLAVGASATLFFLAKYWLPLLLKSSPSYMRTSIRSPFSRWFKRVQPENSRMNELQFSPEQETIILDVFNDFKRCIESDIELTNMMFYGPPGTGKTMTARAIALELGCEYILVNSPELSQLPDEEAIQALKYVIELAKHCKKPVLIFFDEADAIFMHRGKAPIKERKMTNELLSLLPEAYAKGMACIFATNLPDSLDPAFKRRIGRKIYFGLPNQAARTTLLGQYIGKFAAKCNLGVDRELQDAIPQLAIQLAGFSGSDIAELGHEIRLATLKENRNSITLSTSQSVITRKKAENRLEETTTYDHTAAQKPQEVENETIFQANTAHSGSSEHRQSNDPWD